AAFGKRMEPVAGLVGAEIKGRTKVEAAKLFSTTRSNDCYQHVGILQRKGSEWKIRASMALALQTTSQKAQHSEKGAVVLEVEVEGPAAQSGAQPPQIRLCFMSTHLNAGKGQAEELNGHIIALAELAAKKWTGHNITPSDTQIRFLMGDLNFRLQPNTATP